MCLHPILYGVSQLAAGTHHFMPTIIYQVAAGMDGYIADADGGV